MSSSIAITDNVLVISTAVALANLSEWIDDDCQHHQWILDIENGSIGIVNVATSRSLDHYKNEATQI